MKPLRVEVIAYAPTAFYHCQHCEVIWKETGFSDGLHEEQVQNALPPELLRDYQMISDWVHHLMSAYGDQVAIQVVDATSLHGVWKSLRYGLHRYPAVIVAGQARFVGADFAMAEAELQQRLDSSSGERRAK